MASNIIRLFEPQLLPNAAALLFTALVPTQILKLTVNNTDTAAAYLVTVHLVPQGGAVGDDNMVVNARPLQANESWDVWPAIGEILATGDQIHAFADTAAKVSIFGGGLAVSQ